MALKEPVPRFDAGSDRERTKKEGEEEEKKKSVQAKNCGGPAALFCFRTRSALFEAEPIS